MPLERGLTEIRRVLKPNGTLIVGDRHLISGRGLLKPYHEFRGVWIYPWDSPFRERWYSGGQWRKILRKNGFRVLGVHRIDNPEDSGWRRQVRMNSFVVVSGQRRD